MTSDRHNIAPYPLRLQPEVRARLEAAAKESGRSLHAEIVARLEASFDVNANTTALAALAYRIAHLDSDLVWFQNVLNDMCRYGLSIIERFNDPTPPSEQEIASWRESFEYFGYSEDPTQRRQRVQEKDAAFKEAQFRLHGLTNTRQFDPTHGNGLFQNLGRAALGSLPPASEIYQQSDDEKRIEQKLAEVKPVQDDDTPPKDPTAKSKNSGGRKIK